MINNKTVSLVIPCHNEEEALVYIFQNLPQGFLDEILVVDNNSTDRTAEVAAKMGARVVTETKQGYGFAHQAGFRAATGEIIVAMDGDGTYPLDEIEYLVKQLLERNLDFISGSRFPLKNKEAMFWPNKIGNYVLTAIFDLLTLRRVRDCESGMWVFRRDVLREMDFKNGGIPFSIEIKMEAVLNKKIKFA
jgi:glycosyltransferase involved in cell wall biosynthesis